jgi:hypothetical protein
MIQPTVGKRLWFWPTLAASAYAPYDLNNQPLAATITHVNFDGTVNISYLNRRGELEARPVVYLWQPGMMRPSGAFCEYHPDDLPAVAQIATVAPLSNVEEVIPSTESPSRPILSLKKSESRQ